MKALKPRGFTLIEILISLTIMVLVFGVGFAGYRDFSRDQALESVARTLRGDLRTAQELALSGYKPNHQNCYFNPSNNNPGFLTGYNVTVPVTGTPRYAIYAICTGGNYAQKIVYLPSGYTIVRDYLPDSSVTSQMTPPYFVFRPLSDATNLPDFASTRYTITDTVTNKTAVVYVYPTGEIK